MYKVFQFFEQCQVYNQAKLSTQLTPVQGSNKISQTMLNDLDLFVFTQNMARTHQQINFALILDRSHDVVVWGSQECQMNEKES